MARRRGVGDEMARIVDWVLGIVCALLAVAAWGAGLPLVAVCLALGAGAAFIPMEEARHGHSTWHGGSWWR